MQALTSLRTLLNDVPERLKRLPESKVAVKPDPTAWSGKEELGHLLDSAANNHQRIVRTQLEEHPAMPSYDGERWVVLHHYRQRLAPPDSTLAFAERAVAGGGRGYP